MPKLPNSLNIEFGIVHKSLEVSVFLVQTLSNPKKTAVNETLFASPFDSAVP